MKTKTCTTEKYKVRIAVNVNTTAFWDVMPIGWYTGTKLHGVTSQKTNLHAQSSHPVLIYQYQRRTAIISCGNSIIMCTTYKEIDVFQNSKILTCVCDYNNGLPTLKI